MSSAGRTALIRTYEAHRIHALVLFSLVVYVGITLSHRQQQSDEGSYIRLADEILGRPRPPGGSSDLWFGPGLPVVLAPFVLVHAPLEVMRLLGPLLLVCAVVLFYTLLRIYVSERIALVTATAFGAYLPLYPLLPSLHSEIPAVLLVILFMFALTRDADQTRWRYFMLAAAALAYLALTRVVFGWILAACLVFWLAVWLRRRERSAGRIVAMYALALVLCMPWLAYTYSRSHKVFYWSSAGGQSLYWMASPYPGQLGDWHGEKDVFSNPRLAPNRSDFVEFERLDQVQADTAQQHRALHMIRAHPAHYMRNLSDNLSRLWFNLPYSFTPEHLGTLLYVVPDALLLGCVALSSIVLWRTRRDVATVLRAFIVLLVLGVGIQTLLAAYQRMLVPLVPVILLLAAVSVERVAQLVREPRAAG